jgi:hypothetical protein
VKRASGADVNLCQPSGELRSGRLDPGPAPTRISLSYAATHSGAIDIRVRIVNDGTAFAIHHEDVYEDANFDDVLTKAQAFLQADPSETIVLDLHGECNGDTTEGGIGISLPGLCADDPSNATEAMRESIFQSYVARYPGLFYAPSVTGTSTADTPTLGAARGHIVLTSFTGPSGEVYVGYGLTQLSTGNRGQYVENNWTQCDLASKWSLAQANINLASADAANMYTTYLSASCAPFSADPADMAGGYGGGTGENQDLLNYISAGSVSRTGVVLMDFPGVHTRQRDHRPQPGRLRLTSFAVISSARPPHGGRTDRVRSVSTPPPRSR